MPRQPPHLSGSDPGEELPSRFKPTPIVRQPSPPRPLSPAPSLPPLSSAGRLKKPPETLDEFLGARLGGEIHGGPSNFARNKAFEDFGTLIIPKRYAKALFEIGEGNIPGVKMPVPSGLGGTEEAALQRREYIQRVLRQQQLLLEASARGNTRAAITQAANVLLAIGAARRVGVVYPGLEGNVTIDELLRVMPPDP